MILTHFLIKMCHLLKQYYLSGKLHKFLTSEVIKTVLYEIKHFKYVLEGGKLELI